MTRKHFQALADALKFAHPGLTDRDTPEARATWAEACREVAGVCRSENPRFDRHKFLNACTPAGREGPLALYAATA